MHYRVSRGRHDEAANAGGIGLALEGRAEMDRRGDGSHCWIGTPAEMNGCRVDMDISHRAADVRDWRPEPD